MRVLKAALDMAFDEVTARESKHVAEGELVLRRRRAAALLDGARLVEARWVGLLPRSPSELEQFPGVGRYTAGATAVVVSGVASGFVDAGMARLLRRYFGLVSMSSASEKR